MLSSVIPSSWYDGEIYVDFNKAIQKTLGGKDPDVMEHIGETSAKAGLKGVYSSRLKEADVRMTLSRAASLWKTFHDTGDLTVEFDPNANKAVFKIAGYELPHVEACRNLIGWGRKMIELSGGKNVKVNKSKCVCKGDEYCEMSAEWE
jgi:predicted hydrocarbon binding protein